MSSIVFYFISCYYKVLVSPTKLIFLMGPLNGCDLLGDHPWSGAGCGVRLTCLLISTLTLTSCGILGRGPDPLSLTLLTGKWEDYLSWGLLVGYENVHVKHYALGTW